VRSHTKPTLDAIREFVRDFFEVSGESSDGECLWIRFGQVDPDRFEDFLWAFSKRFSVERPKLKSVRTYLAERWRVNGRDFSDLWFFLDRRPQVFVGSLSICQMLDLARSGVWSERYWEPTYHHYGDR
jgi:hypothetical protein